MKNITTLVADMNAVLKGNGGWDKSINDFFTKSMSEVAASNIGVVQDRKGVLRLSALGKPCYRQQWYDYHAPELGEELSAEALGTFFYGHILEQFAISLAKAAGHRVDGLQEDLEVFGIGGHGDCIIDGVVIDVKSASRYGFEKFKKNGVKEDDPFGYISQLSSYLHAYRDDPRVTNKESAGFLVIQKDRFKVCLDMYNLKDELEGKEAEVDKTKKIVTSTTKPERGFSDVSDGKSGNLKLGVGCSYCAYKHHCWPDLRTFIYSTGPRFLTRVTRLPNVPEV